MKTLKCMALSAMVMLGMTGCDDEPAAAPAGVVAARAAAPSPASSDVAKPAEAVAAAPHVYAYNPLGKRDPFRSPMDDLQRVSQESQASSCADPLCQWDLGQLRLVAVVTGDSNPMGMVEDPLGRGHVVRRGARMGRQGGKVTQILRDSVTVTEYFPAPDGKVLSNPVSLQLASDQKQDTAFNLQTGKYWE